MPDILFENPHNSMEYSSVKVVTTLADGWAASPTEFADSDEPIKQYWFLQQFEMTYAPIHAYLSAIISVMGVFANVLVIIIMLRPDMRTPTNRLYAVMAFADLITMLLYSIFAICFQLIMPESNIANLTRTRAIFMVIYADLSVFVHSLSVMIMVAVTLFRVLILKLPGPTAKQHCNLQRANLTAVICFFGCFLITLPNIIVTSWRGAPKGAQEFLFWEVYQREDDFSKTMAVTNFWLQAIFVKLLPCLLLTLASIAIVRTLREAEARKRRLQGDKPGHHGTDARIRNRTIMLLSLLVVFLLTEFPQGILTLVCGIMGDAVWSSIYMPLGNFLDMLTLINAGVNFVLFVSMSSEFRDSLNKQLSEWFHCYAVRMEKRRAAKQEKRLAKIRNRGGVTNNTPTTGASPATQIAESKAAGANANVDVPNEIIDDGELEPIKPRSVHSTTSATSRKASSPLMSDEEIYV